MTAIVVGTNDLADSMGHMGNPQHSEVQSTIDTSVGRLRKHIAEKA